MAMSMGMRMCKRYCKYKNIVTSGLGKIDDRQWFCKVA